MEGISSAYFLHPIAPGILGATAYFAQAAKEASVTAIVNMSQISARRESTSHAAQDHWVSERVFDWSDVATTHLRPTFFADWLVYPHFAKEIWAKKKIEFPFANGRHAPIGTDDQGRVIAHLLANPKDLGQDLHPPWSGRDEPYRDRRRHERSARCEDRLMPDLDRGIPSEDRRSLHKLPTLPGTAPRRSRSKLPGRHLRGHERYRGKDHRNAGAVGPGFYRKAPSGVCLIIALEARSDPS